MKAKELPINEIKANPDLMMRSRLDASLVTQYSENLETITALAPIEVYKVDGKYILTDGFHRLAAARQLEWDAISAKVFEGTFQDAHAAACLANLRHGKPLSRKERKKAICEYIKLRIRMGNSVIAKEVGVSKETIRRYLAELVASGIVEPQEKRTGLDGKKRTTKTTPRVLTGTNVPVEDAADEPTIDPFDEWFNNHIRHGNALEMLPSLERKFDLGIIDPPYGITTEEWDLTNEHDLLAFTRRWLNLVIPRIKLTGRLYIFWSREYVLELKPLLNVIAEAHPITFGGIIVWHMTNVQSMPDSRKRYKLSWEPIFYYYGLRADDLNFPKTEVTGEDWKGKGEIQSDVWSFPIPQSNFKKDKKVHPTQKPLGLYRRIIETATRMGDSVLDPFAGSGTTGHAALETGRDFLLIENHLEYIEKTKSRLKPVWEAQCL